jgi:hypothetical protein
VCTFGGVLLAMFLARQFIWRRVPIPLRESEAVFNDRR